MLIVLAALSALGLAACRQQQPPRAATPSLHPDEVMVDAGTAASLRFGLPEQREVAGSLQVPARVETDARRIARVGSPVAGRILRLLAFEGQQVGAGVMLAMLHSTALSDTQFALIRAASQQDLAAAGVKRAEALLEANVIGQAELDRRRAEYLQASTEASSYRTQLLGLGMTAAQIRQVESSRRLSADYPIVSPKSGTVLKREINIGQVVQPADPAFTIADLSTVWIVANVPEQEAGLLETGMQVTVRVPAAGSQDMPGRLSFVSPIVNPETRTVEVRMDLANPQGTLKPDELASMTFTGQSERRLTVPAAAVVRENNRDYVFAESAPGRYRLREVSLGEEDRDRRVVLGGLEGGEKIVTDGAFHLNNQRKQKAIKGGH
jgi:cobalt-zinc-cadmium efflux system membrane fusion protein